MIVEKKLKQYWKNLKNFFKLKKPDVLVALLKMQIPNVPK